MAVNRRNSALKIYTTGPVANSLYGLAKKVGSLPSRLDGSTRRAQASLARRVQPVAKREIRAAYNIKASLLNKRMRLEYGNRKKSNYISLWASARRLSLLEFQGRWGGRPTPGATAAILKGVGKTYAGAFIARVGKRSTGPAIYVRQLQEGGKRAPRGPLTRLYGPSVYDMLTPGPGGPSAPATVRRRTLAELEDYYVTELRRQIAVELRRG